jgi:hypothetical protein
LVNADAETLGVDADVELDPVLVPAVELEDELPQAETAMLAVIASAAKTILLLSKCTVISPPTYATTPSAHGVDIQRSSQLANLRSSLGRWT